MLGLHHLNNTQYHSLVFSSIQGFVVSYFLGGGDNFSYSKEMEREDITAVEPSAMKSEIDKGFQLTACY